MSLRHRMPVKLRQHWKLLAASLVMVVVLAVGFGSTMVRPTITSALSTKEQLLENINGTTDFFDSGEHSISINYNETEYQDMVKEFQSNGEKKFIGADITIDGTLIENVGLRLKGNSTLSSLRSDSSGTGPGGQGFPGAARGAVASAPASDTAIADVPDAAIPDGAAAGGLGRAQLSFDDPQGLPWVISVGEFVEGRAYEGNTEFSLRPATSGSTTAVNEALALAMTKESGQITQDYSLASVSVNGGESESRIVVDLPDGQWANELGDGVLYKADASGSMDYVGDDPTDYENSYKQINSVGTYDLQPVMRLLDFVNNSSDENFAEKLDEYLDVDAFAEYLATQALLSNGDAMDGPGNNYYLWYNTDDEKFTVLSWDLNMALSGMGGALGGAAMGAPGAAEDAAPGDMPADMPALPDGFAGDAPGGDDGARPEGFGGEGGGSRGSGILKERFLADAGFAKLYEQTYARLYEQLISSGYAQDALEGIVDRATDSGDAGAVALGETISQKLSSTSATSTAEDAKASSMGGGRGGTAGRTARNTGTAGTASTASTAESTASTAGEVPENSPASGARPKN